MDQKIREEVFQDCAEDLCRGRRLSRDQWRILLEGRTRERAEKMAEKASALRDRIYGKRIFIRGLIEFTNYWEMTATTAASGKATKRLPDTGFPKERSWNAAGRDTVWDSAPLYSREGRIPITMTRGSQNW